MLQVPRQGSRALEHAARALQGKELQFLRLRGQRAKESERLPDRGPVHALPAVRRLRGPRQVGAGLGQEVPHLPGMRVSVREVAPVGGGTERVGRAAYAVQQEPAGKVRALPRLSGLRGEGRAVSRGRSAAETEGTDSSGGRLRKWVVLKIYQVRRVVGTGD